MQVPTFFTQKKTVVIEIVVLILFLVGMYYLYISFSEEQATVTTSQANQALLGQNFTLFLKAVNQDKLSFKDVSFLSSDFASQLQDFSQNFPPTVVRGRVDPFVPYASSRPLR